LGVQEAPPHPPSSRLPGRATGAGLCSSAIPSVCANEVIPDVAAAWPGGSQARASHGRRCTASRQPGAPCLARSRAVMTGLIATSSVRELSRTGLPHPELPKPSTGSGPGLPGSGLPEQPATPDDRHWLWRRPGPGRRRPAVPRPPRLHARPGRVPRRREPGGTHHGDQDAAHAGRGRHSRGPAPRPLTRNGALGSRAGPFRINGKRHGAGGQLIGTGARSSPEEPGGLCLPRHSPQG
jgi:hypothetical protein